MPIRLALAALLLAVGLMVPAPAVEPLAVPDPALTSTTRDPAFAPAAVAPGVDPAAPAPGRQVRWVGFILGAALAVVLAAWLLRRNRTVYTDPTINPNNNVVNPTYTEPGSNLPPPRNPVA